MTEREQFDAWWAKGNSWRYADENAAAWLVWQARAALAQPCGCLIGTCESKPDRVCRMLQELQEGGHQ